MLTMRELTKNDLPEVIAMEARAFSHPWPPEAFEDLSFTDSLLLCDDDTMLGYIMYHRVLDECAIVNFAIDPPMQGKGYGQVLLQKAIQRIVSQHIRFVYLDVRISNAAARHLYEKMGFRRMGIRRGYYTHPDEDSLVMMKDLESSETHA